MSRKRNWSKYNKNLVNRGSITFFIDQESLKIKPKRKSRGRPRLFSNPLIQTLLILKVQFRLPYRALEGFSKCVLPLLLEEASLPTYSLICKRAKELEESLPKLSSRRPKVILLDASGIKIFGEGEWKVKVHGESKRRKWIKIHVAVDERSQEIVGLKVTKSTVADCVIGPQLIQECPGGLEEVKADGGYDAQRVRSEIEKRGAKGLIPPRRNSRCRGISAERDEAVREMRGFGQDRTGKSLWGKITGYSRRSLVEASFSRLKRLYGPEFFSRDIERQRIEGHLKCWMMNKMREEIR